MKLSVKKDIHNGEQPIRVLKHNLTSRLVDRNETLLKKLFSELKLSDKIGYNIAKLPLNARQTPFINEVGLIQIHETFLSYIWIISFSMFVLYEEGIVIPDQIKRNLPPRKSQNFKLIENAKELFNYGKSLVVVYTDWDKENLPNPEYFDEETEEGWYILRSNDLYVEAINFILYHEIAHAELNHFDKKKFDTVDVKQLEMEADTRAINLMMENYRNDKATKLGVVIGLASLLFFNSNLNGGKQHPNVDQRIDNFIKIINPEIDSPIWAFLVIFVKLWEEQFSHNFIQNTHYDNFKELYYELIRQAE